MPSLVVLPSPWALLPVPLFLQLGYEIFRQGISTVHVPGVSRSPATLQPVRALYGARCRERAEPGFCTVLVTLHGCYVQEPAWSGKTVAEYCYCCGLYAAGPR